MKRAFGIVATCLGLFAGAAGAQPAPTATFTPAGEVAWSPAGPPGVEIAVVHGSLKSPGHFYLRYPPGLVTPLHHHTPDHYATTLSGTLVLAAEGRESRLAPGSYFAFTGKAKHVARCVSAEPCVMFIDARGAWDVVAASAGAKR